MFIAVAVAFVMLYSVIYISAESSHECTGENCPVCHQISICQSTLKELSAVVLAAAISAVALIYNLCMCFYACTNFVQRYTLVSLKVKLSN